MDFHDLYTPNKKDSNRKLFILLSIVSCYTIWLINCVLLVTESHCGVDMKYLYDMIYLCIISMLLNNISVRRYMCKILFHQRYWFSVLIYNCTYHNIQNT